MTSSLVFAVMIYPTRFYGFVPSWELVSRARTLATAVSPNGTSWHPNARRYLVLNHASRAPSVQPRGPASVALASTCTLAALAEGQAIYGIRRHRCSARNALPRAASVANRRHGCQRCQPRPRLPTSLSPALTALITLISVSVRVWASAVQLAMTAPKKGGIAGGLGGGDVAEGELQGGGGHGLDEAELPEGAFLAGDGELLLVEVGRGGVAAGGAGRFGHGRLLPGVVLGAIDLLNAVLGGALGLETGLGPAEDGDLDEPVPEAFAFRVAVF